MSRLGAEKLLAVGAVWLLIMLPSAAFGRFDADAQRTTAGAAARLAGSV